MVAPLVRHCCSNAPSGPGTLYSPNLVFRAQACLRSGSTQIVGVPGLRSPFELIFPAIQQLALDPQLPRQLVDVVASLHPLHSLLLELPAVPPPLAQPTLP